MDENVGFDFNHTSCFSHLHDKVPDIGNIKEKGSVQLIVSEVSAHDAAEGYQRNSHYGSQGVEKEFTSRGEHKT